MRVEKELANSKNLKEKVTDLELQLAGLSQVRNESDKSMLSLRRDLDTVNRLLEDNDNVSNDRFTREINYLTNKYESEIADLHMTLERERKQLNELHAEEKESLIENYESKIIELRKHLFFENREIDENGSVTGSKGMDELEESYKLQISKLEEKVVLLETEKAEMELTFLNQKA